jgi:hypothetical protein
VDIAAYMTKLITALGFYLAKLGVPDENPGPS